MLVAGLSHAAVQLDRPRRRRRRLGASERRGAKRGLAPIAAMSLTLTTIALYPRSRADVSHGRSARPRSARRSSGRARRPGREDGRVVARTDDHLRAGARQDARDRGQSARPRSAPSTLRSGQPAADLASGWPELGGLGISLDSRPSSRASGRAFASTADPTTRRTNVARGLRQPLAGGAPVASPRRCRRCRITEFGNVNVQTRVLSRSAGSTFVVDRGPSSGQDDDPRGVRRASRSCRTTTSRDHDTVVIDGYIGNDPELRTARAPHDREGEREHRRDAAEALLPSRDGAASRRFT